MPKLEDALIPMLQSFNENQISIAKNAPALPIFSDQVIAFLSDLSKEVIKQGRAYSDVVTFGYWCRSASIKKLASRYKDDPIRLGKGFAFHIAPSNVPVNFAFSLVTGLLAGNSNIVKVPSKDFPQVEIISQAIDSVLENHPTMRQYIQLIRYDRTSEATRILSALCDARIIWGGDSTVLDVRTNPIPPRTTEIAFADRNSFAIIDAHSYLEIENKVSFAQNFYNDTYFSDQNACTAPRLIAWIGPESTCKKAQQLFWSSLKEIVDEYELAPVHAVGKLAALYQCAAHRTAKLSNTINEPKIIRVEIDELDSSLFNDRYHSGFFFEYCTEDLSDLLSICDDPSVQTVSYFGDIADSIANYILQSGVAGVDRIVPIGKTMDFDLTWDGMDLIRQLSRVLSII